MRTPLLPLMFAFTAAALFAQAPHEDWMTLETEHFRIHYPAEYAAWTLRLASRMETIHTAVMAEVGFNPREKADVLIMDPVAQANGMAVPFLKYPRMVLWATPPESWSPIGNYRDWPELLFLHEDVHLVHLLRPSRGGWGKFVEWLMPLGAVGRKAPRWVSEGYATYLEGKLTGVGRPNGDFRAAVLRKWALEGKLPSYGQMSNDAESWMGMSMAYLMGSAYMEWLIQRTDDGAWKRLWARLTAKKERSFDAAFEGVFGDPPAKMYDRYCADLTWRAKELEREMKPVLAEGELWQDTSWNTGEPALTPDGSKMAIVLRAKNEPSRLVVWDTKPEPEAPKKWDESLEKIRKGDPEDSPGVRTKPFPHKELFRMPLAAAKEPANPRWMPDGKSILFTACAPDANGFYSPDLYLWTPEGGEVRRVTKGAHVKEADPFPDGRQALGVRSEFGSQSLVIVDLAVGAVHPPPVPLDSDAAYDHPRVHPDGTACFLSHRDGKWTAVIQNMVVRESPRFWSPPEGMTLAFPTWDIASKRLLVSVGRNGFVDVCTWGSDGRFTTLARTMGAAFAPQPTPDGKGLYFLSLETDGLDVRYIVLEPGPSAQRASLADPFLAPAVRPIPPQGLEFMKQEVGAPKPYSAGRQEFSFLFGGHWTSYTEAWEAGVRGGDVLGRWNYFLAGGAGRDGAPQGGTFALGWRGWPVEVTAQAYKVDQDPSEQKGWADLFGPDFYNLWERDRRGVSLSFGREWAFRRGTLGVEAGGLWEKIETNFIKYDWDRSLAYLEGSGIRTRPLGSWEVLAALSARGEWGETDGDGWTRGRVTARIGLRRQDSALMVAYEARELNGVEIGQHRYEQMTLGGTESTLLPAAARFDEILDPAFWQAQSAGDRYEGWRVDLTMGGLPLFYQRHRLRWDAAVYDDGDWLDLAGLEWDMTSGPLAIVRLPGFHLTLGGAYIFDAPLEGKTRFWLGLSWMP